MERIRWWAIAIEAIVILFAAIDSANISIVWMIVIFEIFVSIKGVLRKVVESEIKRRNGAAERPQLALFAESAVDVSITVVLLTMLGVSAFWNNAPNLLNHKITKIYDTTKDAKSDLIAAEFTERRPYRIEKAPADPTLAIIRVAKDIFALKKQDYKGLDMQASIRLAIGDSTPMFTPSLVVVGLGALLSIFAVLVTFVTLIPKPDPPAAG